VGLAGIALAYPALHLVSGSDGETDGRAESKAVAPITGGLMTNTVGGVRLVRSTAGRGALSWLLLLAGNVLSVVYLAAIGATGRS